MKKNKVLSISYCIAFFVLLCIAYASPFSLIRDTYGLCSGQKTTQYVTDFFSLVSDVYMKIADSLFLFFGEKSGVITGFHIGCCFASFFLLFLALGRFHKPGLTFGVPVLLLVLPFVLAQVLNYDGWILVEFFVCLLFYLVVCALFAILKLDYGVEDSLMKETLSEREKRESQAPKTIVNAKGETITLLANPLPGPKKHVKRTLDYDVDVPESKMFYDKNECDFDDYDIR